MQALITKEEIALAKTKQDLLKETAMQLQKDFNLHGVSIEIAQSHLNSYDALLKEVSFICEQLLRENAEKFFSILYSIDIGEQKIRHVLAENQSNQSLGGLVLERELLKVLTKKHFAQR